MEVIIDKKTDITILNYEAKYFFLFLNDEVENKNFLLLNLFDYCYFVFNTKNNQ